MRGLLEARQGSGVYGRAGGQPPPPPRDLDIGAFDQAEARRLFEGEAAALAATLITDEELAYLETLVAEMNSEKSTKEQSELADRQFHITIAQATRNSAIVHVVENTWDLRYKSRLCMQMLEKARHVRKRPLNDEHQDIIESLRTRDPKAARSAMQTHLGGLIENLLLTAELEAMEQTRERLASKRKRSLCGPPARRSRPSPAHPGRSPGSRNIRPASLDPIHRSIRRRREPERPGRGSRARRGARRAMAQREAERRGPRLRAGPAGPPAEWRR